MSCDCTDPTALAPEYMQQTTPALARDIWDLSMQVSLKINGEHQYALSYR